MASSAEYEAYKQKNEKLIRSMLAEMGCRPVLFVGSGLTRRYLSGPSWMELLWQIASSCDIPSDKFSYLSQKAGNDPIALGALLAEEVHQWAFTKGRKAFPPDYYDAGSDRDLFIKHIAANLLNDLSKSAPRLDENLRAEIDSFKAVSPHAIITTNFDTFVDDCYPDFERIVGEKIIPFSLSITGELYKIHGTVSDPASLVLTGRDYDRFASKRRYISSKMMTYFAEFPVFIFGYSLNDSNVNSIISDLGEALRDRGGLLENVFVVRRVQSIESIQSLQEEHAITVSDGALPPLRVRTIMAEDFRWIYDCLGDTANPLPISTKTLRHLAARVVELVRVDVPKSKVEINFDQITRLSEDSAALAQVLGISNVHNPNLQYPYSPTTLGKKLGYRGWHKANRLIAVLNDRLGYDIKASDNDYHLLTRVGERGEFHKYSELLVDALKAIKGEAA